MRVVCVSDTHGFGRRIAVPDGDLLVHAGDLTFRGTEDEVTAELDWLASLPHARKVFVAGNHDWFFDPNMPARFHSWNLRRTQPVAAFLARYPGLTYLQDGGTTLADLRIWGSPWQPNFMDWAFNFPKAGDAAPTARWAQIPADTQLLITHSPPAGILDRIANGAHAGDAHLARRLADLPQLRLHVFGHLHESYGRDDRAAPGGGTTAFVNAAACTERYDPTNPPIVVDL